MFAKILQLLVGLLGIINPIQNETKGQKAGTYVTIVVAVLSTAILVMQTFWTTPTTGTVGATVVSTDTVDSRSYTSDMYHGDVEVTGEEK